MPHKTHEITLRVIILSVLLSVVLAISNTYLALKIGLLTSASIPAAVISMGILSFFKNSNIFENNLVQTAASAGEAVAGGIVYTIPALIVIEYWTQFPYWQCFWIALTGGVLGVMFSIPLRRIMMNDKSLNFPEGRAVAEVLKISDSKSLGVKDILYGGLVGSLIELLQTGFKLLADSWQLWFQSSRTLFGFGVGFSPLMIGAGYLIGFSLAISILIGALIGWLVLIPIFSHIYPEYLNATGSAMDLAQSLWGQKIRYIGIGAMLTAGILMLFNLIKPLAASLRLSAKAMHQIDFDGQPHADKDLPLPYVFGIGIVFVAALAWLFQTILPVTDLGLNAAWLHGITYAAVAYCVFAGFIFCAITAYFSGMVGVSASPGSSILIAGLLLAALLLNVVLSHHGFTDLTANQILSGEAIVIICISVIMGMAAISNDNMQDLKVGHIIGATPWKQQVMLLIGVICAAAIIPPVMQKLYSVYGIAGVMPRPGMNMIHSLPAPPAAVTAILSKVVFQHQVPWTMLLIGAAISLCVAMFNFANRKSVRQLSILGVAMGIYLPLATSTPLFIGGLFALLVKRRNKIATHRDTVLACGLIAGPALLDVLLAIPFSIMQSPDALNIAPACWPAVGVALSILVTLGLYRWFKRV